MADEWRFEVRSNSSKSTVDYSPYPTANMRNSGEKAYPSCPAPSPGFLGRVVSGAENGIYRGANTVTFGGLDKVKSTVTYAQHVWQKLSPAYMSQFGFNPCSDEVCPILQAPSPESVGALAAKLVPGDAGSIFTDAVDLSRYTGKHFYIVAAKCGNVNTIARIAGLPADKVKARLGSMLGMIATWAGCMMAGGATIYPADDALRDLDNMDSGGPARKSPIFGEGVLTDGWDMVQLQNPTRAVSGDTQLHTFLARTKYYHSLEGTVLHMQYIAAGGDVTWLWVGGGGKSFISKYVNNFVAINIDFGIWPDMGRYITKFYADPAVVRKFVNAAPQAIKQIIPELIRSSENKRGFFLRLREEEQVNNGPANDIRRLGVLTHWGNGVKGE